MLDRLGAELFDDGRRRPNRSCTPSWPTSSSRTTAPRRCGSGAVRRARRDRPEEGRPGADRLGRSAEADYHPPRRAGPPQPDRRRSSQRARWRSASRPTPPPMATPEPNHQCVERCPICRGADVLRSTSTPELRGQWQTVQREALVTMRAMIDHYLERLDEDEQPRPRGRGHPDRMNCLELRHREPRPGPVLHVLWLRPARPLPELRGREPAEAKFCIECGTPLDGGPAPLGRRADRTACRRSGARRRSCSPTSRATPRSPSAWTRRRMKSHGRPRPAPPRRGGRALRRHDRQVHRRQRDGRLRGPGRPRGRPRARRARRAGDAGGDGARSTSGSPPTSAPTSRCGSGSTPARCWRGRSATATR